MARRTATMELQDIVNRLGVGLELRDSEGLMGFAEAAGGWR